MLNFLCYNMNINSRRLVERSAIVYAGGYLDEQLLSILSAVYDYIHEQQIEKANKVRMYQDQYKNY